LDAIITIITTRTARGRGCEAELTAPGSKPADAENEASGLFVCLETSVKLCTLWFKISLPTENTEEHREKH